MNGSCQAGLTPATGLPAPATVALADSRSYPLAASTTVPVASTLIQAAAQELRTDGIHVALLAVDATIESPKTEAFTRDQPAEALADMGEIASAVSFLVNQGARALTHELTVTPAGERWVP